MTRDPTPPLLTDPFVLHRRIRRWIYRGVRFIAPVPAETPPAPLYNVATTDPGASSGRVLIQYESWTEGTDVAEMRRHARANAAKTVLIVDAFRRLGYTVDVVDWRDAKFVPRYDYDVFFGMAANFPVLLKRFAKRPSIVIYWATRSSPDFEAAALSTREQSLRARRGVTLRTIRAIETQREPPEWRLADAVILIGNDTTRSTYSGAAIPVIATDSAAPELGEFIPGGRQYPQATRTFLFLSSFWFVHKGLDLVLEAFAARPQLTLWICAPLQAEIDFLAAYRRELFHTKNIHPVGWVESASLGFATIASRCGFSIFPSCSEGQAGSVLTSMAAGLVPVVTPEAGVDIDDFGVTILDATPQGVIDTIDRCASMSEAEWRGRMKASTHRANTRFSFEAFGARMESALRQVLNSSYQADDWSHVKPGRIGG